MKLISLLFALVTVHSIALAQDVLVSGGGETSGAGGSASYSVGQVFISTYEDNNGSVSEGIQQTYVISVLGEITSKVLANANIFPNQAQHYITLSIDNYNKIAGELSYYFYNLNGTLLDNKVMVTPETNIDMEHLASGIYFVKLINGQKLIKTFRVVKNEWYLER